MRRRIILKKGNDCHRCLVGTIKAAYLKKMQVAA